MLLFHSVLFIYKICQLHMIVLLVCYLHDCFTGDDMYSYAICIIVSLGMTRNIKQCVMVCYSTAQAVCHRRL